jgi:hypothetical protein
MSGLSFVLLLNLGFLLIHVDDGRHCLYILTDSIKALFALARLLIPTLTDGLEHITSVKVSSVSVVIDGDRRVQVNS